MAAPLFTTASGMNNLIDCKSPLRFETFKRTLLSCWKDFSAHSRITCTRQDSHLPCPGTLSTMDGDQDSRGISGRLSKKSAGIRSVIAFGLFHSR